MWTFGIHGLTGRFRLFPRTFQLKPGVLIGDIGKKMGRDGIDNGYIQVSLHGAVCETLDVRDLG